MIKAIAILAISIGSYACDSSSVGHVADGSYKQKRQILYSKYADSTLETTLKWIECKCVFCEQWYRCGKIQSYSTTIWRRDGE